MSMKPLDWSLAHCENEAISRRDFLGRCGRMGIGLCAASMLGPAALALGRQSSMTSAMYYRRLGGGRTRCMMCPNGCVRGSGENGQCRARGNRGGRYYSLVYGRPCVLALDDVEKCPLYHFPISGKVFSIATAGCNLACHYCQNWEFSQAGPDEVPKSYELTPREVVAKAVANKAGAIAFFYTEPTVYYEYMLGIAKLARRRGLKTVMVTAGYIKPDPLKNLLPHIDAVTVGLKGWNDQFYSDYIHGQLSHVKKTIEVLAATDGVWWEVVNLIIPSLNDSMEEIARMSAWLCRTAGAHRPLHFTRFRPAYKLKRLPMTPTATLTAAREVALGQGLKYVYVDNLPGHAGANTYCPDCGRMIVERLSFTVLSNKINKGACSFCGHKIEGVWQ